MMNVLIIGTVWPEPGSSGASLRMMEWIKLFQQQQWQINYATTAAASEYMVDLNAMGLTCQSISVNDSSFDAYIEGLQPELVLFDRFVMEEQFGWRVETICPQAIRVIETVEFHTLRQARLQAYKRAPGVIHEVTKADLYNEVALREVAAIQRSDLSVLVSDYEMELLQSEFAVSNSQLHLCPFMFETDQINRASAPFDQRQDFIFIGNFRHPPNWDAVLWLKQQIWPKIREKLPHAKLHVYGAYPPPKATALHKAEQGFLVHGRVEDVNVVMKQARVCLAPMRVGAGIKTKLADAMLNGTPTVTTSVGAEAMSGSLLWCGSISDEVDAFVAEAEALYGDKSRWQQAQLHGYNIVEQLFSAEKNGEALIARIAELRDQLLEQRLNNFTGAMLRHHHSRSSEFMSRWIEAKNQL